MGIGIKRQEADQWVARDDSANKLSFELVLKALRISLKDADWIASSVDRPVSLVRL